MFDFNKLYELAPTLSDDEEIKSHLCNIVKNLEQAVPTDEEISQLTSEEVIERVSSFFNNASSKLFTDLSRQRSRDKKGYKATQSLDRLSSHILDSLEQTLSQLNVEQIHMRQAKFTYLQTIILSDIFSIGNHVDVSIKDVIAFFSFVSYVSNNLEILDQLDFTPGYTHPVDIEYWMNLIPDKPGCAFDLLSDYNLPLELNSHQISEALNNACGF